MKLTPTTLENRIETIDFLRGFALLGIFIANMLLFHTPYLSIDPYSWFTTPGDIEAFKWIDIFVEASFYPLFALLFGYGLNMQYEKAVSKQILFAPVMARRLGILLGFGFLHALFIWSGDVLFPYAVLGFLMILFVRIPAKWLTPFALVLYIIPTGLLFLVSYFIVNSGSSLITADYANIQEIELAISAYAHGTWIEIFIFRFYEWLVIGLGGTLMGLFIVLPIIMLGAALSKWKVIERASEIKGRLVALIVVGFGIGIWIKMLPYLGEPTYDLVMLQDTFGGVFLAAGYFGLILLVCMIPQFRIVFRPIAKVGQMSLTTYIMQSVIATLIFYAYGFGLYGKVDVVTGTWIAVGVFVIQAIFAEIWLSKFRRGPLEWIWRKGTYGKISSK